MSIWPTFTTARTITSAQWALKPRHSKQQKHIGRSHHSSLIRFSSLLIDLQCDCSYIQFLYDDLKVHLIIILCVYICMFICTYVLVLLKNISSFMSVSSSVVKL